MDEERHADRRAGARGQEGYPWRLRCLLLRGLSPQPLPRVGERAHGMAQPARARCVTGSAGLHHGADRPGARRPRLGRGQLSDPPGPDPRAARAATRWHAPVVGHAAGRCGDRGRRHDVDDGRGRRCCTGHRVDGTRVRVAGGTAGHRQPRAAALLDRDRPRRRPRPASDGLSHSRGERTGVARARPGRSLGFRPGRLGRDARDRLCRKTAGERRPRVLEGDGLGSRRPRVGVERAGGVLAWPPRSGRLERPLDLGPRAGTAPCGAEETPPAAGPSVPQAVRHGEAGEAGGAPRHGARHRGLVDRRPPRERGSLRARLGRLPPASSRPVARRHGPAGGCGAALPGCDGGRWLVCRVRGLRPARGLRAAQDRAEHLRQDAGDPLPARHRLRRRLAGEHRHRSLVAGDRLGADPGGRPADG